MRTARSFPTYLRPVSAPTAILLFSRTAGAEARSKALGPAGTRVATALIRRTQRTLRRTGLPVYHYDEHLQRGADFGHKLAEAVREVFAHGHQRVIVVGNDCPSLGVAAIGRAARVLGNGQPVIGPDGRGGVWLIGLQSGSFDAAGFAGLNWQTPTIADELTEHLGDCRRLTLRRDVNRLAELVRHWARLKALLSSLAFLLMESVKPPVHAYRIDSTVALPAPVLRGPPRG